MTPLPSLYSHVFISDGLETEAAKDRYKQRRQHCLDAFNAPILISSVLKAPSAGEPWAHGQPHLYQEPLFHYLTGINQFPAALLLHPDYPDGILFLPKKDPHMAFWEGFSFGFGSQDDHKALSTLSGFTDIRDYETLFKTCFSLLRGASTLFSFWYAVPKGKKSLPGCLYEFKRKLQFQISRAGLSIKLQSIEPWVWTHRLVLDPTDQTNLRHANDCTAQVFKRLCASIHNAETELDIFAQLQFDVYKHSRWGHSFSPIVAGGKNAAVLHYTKNDAPLHKNDLLLLDFGVRHFSMPADVSRTIPLSGTFNPLQKALYSIVLEAQSLVEKTVRSGVTIDALNTLCWKFINSKMDTFLAEHQGTWEKPYQVQPHNVGHLLGIMVHDGDPYRAYRSSPLKSGMVLTNEPGLYGTIRATIEGKQYHETLGIRIEDNLLVTDTGCLNLSESCPKSIADIETLLKR